MNWLEKYKQGNIFEKRSKVTRPLGSEMFELWKMRPLRNLRFPKSGIFPDLELGAKAAGGENFGVSKSKNEGF